MPNNQNKIQRDGRNVKPSSIQKRLDYNFQGRNEGNDTNGPNS